MNLLFNLVALTCLVSCLGAPPKFFEENLSEKPTGSPTKEKPTKESSFLYKLEKKVQKKRDPIENVMTKVFSSKTANAVDEIVSRMVSLAGGIVEDLGDMVVESIDQLPETIRTVSDVVGKAVDLKREKVLIIVKGVRPKDGEHVMKETVDRISTAVENSKVQSSLDSLEEVFASFVGKLIGVAYQNAQDINSAITSGFRRITEGGIRRRKITPNVSKEASEPLKTNEIDINKKA